MVSFWVCLFLISKLSLLSRFESEHLGRTGSWAPVLRFRVVCSGPVLPTTSVLHQRPASSLGVNWNPVRERAPRRANSVHFREEVEVRAQGWKRHLWIWRMFALHHQSQTSSFPEAASLPSKPGDHWFCSRTHFCLFVGLLTASLLLLVSSTSRIQAPQQRDAGSIRFFGETQQLLVVNKYLRTAGITQKP